MKYIRKLYDWVLAWAYTPYGTMALFVLAFTESSIFPIPPDVLLLALCLGNPKRSFLFALICSVSSVIGGLFGYLIGHYFWYAVGDFFLKYVFSIEFFTRVQQLYDHNAFLAVFISGFTPIPYKVFTIAAGVFDINLLVFASASILGRSLRFFIVATLIYKLGAPVKNIIEKYFGLFTILFGILLIAGFVVVKFLLH